MDGGFSGLSNLLRGRHRLDVLLAKAACLGLLGRREAQLEVLEAAEVLAETLDLAERARVASRLGDLRACTGDRDGAIAQLGEIERRAGRDSREFVQLADALVAATDKQLFRY